MKTGGTSLTLANIFFRTRLSQYFIFRAFPPTSGGRAIRSNCGSPHFPLLSLTHATRKRRTGSGENRSYNCLFHSRRLLFSLQENRHYRPPQTSPTQKPIYTSFARRQNSKRTVNQITSVKSEFIPSARPPNYSAANRSADTPIVLALFLYISS